MLIRTPALAALLLFSLNTSFAGISQNYYDGVTTASGGATLKATLSAVLKSGSSQIGYDNTWAPLKYIDQSTTNSSDVRLIYGAGARDKEAGAAQDSNPLTGGWSREHGYPQSFFNQNEPMRSDIHALFPCDADVNNRRSNSPYDLVASPTLIDGFGNRSTTSVFEPADVDKGRVARAILYMDARYEGAGGEPDLTIVNAYPGGTGAFQMAYLSTLLNWHRQFPPTAFEKIRNYKAYVYQKNVNPFVDHPEWVAQIFGGAAWSAENGNTLTVAADSPATQTISAGVTNRPVLYVPTVTGGQEVHLASVSLQNIGTLEDGAISTVRLWYDVDTDGLVSGPDSLLAEGNFSAGQCSLSLNRPFSLPTGANQFLVTVDINFQGTNNTTLQVQIPANGITLSASGGNDAPPVFPTLASNTYTVGNPLLELSNLRITEVMEGKSNLKYLELYNPTTGSINLATANLVLRRYSNGSTNPTTITLSSGTIGPDGFYIIANNSADFQGIFGFTPNLSNTNISHNGDDIYDLYQTASSTIIDTFAGDRLGDNTEFDTDRVCHRVIPALPNLGQWGATGTSLPADNGLSPSGYWKVRTISSENSNAGAVGTPGSLSDTSAVDEWTLY